MKSIILIALLMFSGSAFAGDFKTENDTRKFSDEFISYMIKAKFKQAFDFAKPNWPLPTVEIDGLVNTIQQQWPIVSNRFGRSVGSEFVKKERIGKSFLRYYYLHKFKNHAIYWRLDFYKPNKEWKINSITFRDKLDFLFE